MEEENGVTDEAILSALGEDETESPSEEPEAVEVEDAQEPEPEEEDVKVPLKAVQEERRKRQELERKLEEIQKGVTELQSRKTDAPPKDIYEAYDRDAQGVTSQLNTQLKALVDEDPYGNAAKIEQLRDLKDELRRREVVNIQKQLNSQTVASQTFTKLTEAIPDFRNVAESLTKFAVEELGYTQDELVLATDLSRGDAAAREVIRIHRMYQKVHAKPQTKETRPRPTAVENPGKGTQKIEVDYQSLLKEAQRTGNWEKVFDARGLL